MEVNDVGEVEFTGLPQKCLYSLNSFSNQEKLENPLTVLQSVIRILTGVNLDEEMDFDQPQEYDAQPYEDYGERTRAPSETTAYKRLAF